MAAFLLTIWLHLTGLFSRHDVVYTASAAELSGTRCSCRVASSCVVAARQLIDSSARLDLEKAKADCSSDEHRLALAQGVLYASSI